MAKSLLEGILRRLRHSRQSARANPKHASRKKFLLEAMESRVLFSADIAGMLELSGTMPEDDGVQTSIIEASKLETSATGPAGDSDTVAIENPSTELVFVDAGVTDYDRLLADLVSQNDAEHHVEVYVLDGKRDGIEQISEVLAGYTGLDAVHIISHGNDGSIDLGGSTLDSAGLEASAGLIGSWSEALGAEADLLIYGCNLAATEAGQSLVTTLGLLTGADVAASDDLTGSALLGGDWELEYATGSIEASIVVSQQAQQDWANTLAVITVNTTADVINGTDGVTSLREAIIDANDQPNHDTIMLGAGTYDLTILNDLPGAEDAAARGDLDITENLTILGSGSGSTIIDAGAFAASADVDRVFDILGSSVIIKDVQIQNGSGDGGGAIDVDSGSDLSLQNTVITGNVDAGAGGGGAIRNDGILDVQDSIISNNTSPKGGGIENSGVLTLTRVHLADNGTNGPVITDKGGGLYNWGTATLRDVTISGNLADKGGAIYEEFGSLTLTNVTISGNTAMNRGGAIYTQQAAVSATNVTVSYNSSPDAGGFYLGGTGADVVLKNSIVANNTAATDPNSSAPVTSLGNNIVDDLTTIAVPNTTPGQEDQVNTDPLLDPVLNLNGGSTPTHALLAGSPAINKADASSAPLADQRGVTRDTAPDIGAFEFLTNASLWFSTQGAGDTGTATWNDNEIVQFTDPNLKFDPQDGTTAGTFSLLPGFSAPYDIRAMHYVESTITIGTTGNQTVLQAGDVLLTLDPGNTEVTAVGLTFGRHDILLFRPTTAGDYSSGTYSMLLDEGIHDASTAYNSHAITLVEQDTMVGSTLLQAGTFIVARSTPAEHDNLYVINVIGTGAGAATQTDNMQLLLDGDLLGLSDQQIQGLELIENTTIIGGETFAPGTLLMTLNNSVPIVVGGSTSVAPQDIFSLDISSTEIDAPGSTAATASLMFDGSDVGMEATPPPGQDERINALTLKANVNIAPVITSVDVTGSITEGSTLTDSGSITFTDVDATDTPTASEVTKSVATTLTLTAAQQAAIEDAFTISAAAGNTNNGTINWDYTITEAELDFLALGETVTVVYTITVDDARGGTDTRDVTVVITGANDAPVIASVNITGSITEGGTLTDSGSITFTDVDLTDTPAATEATKSVATTLTLTAAQQAAIEDAFTISADAGNTNNGTINWDYTITEAELDFLAAGEMVTAVFTITVDDGNGGTDTRDVTVTITGDNDAPVITSVDATGSITEGSTLTDSGSITFTDLDLTDTPTASEVTKSVTTTLTLTAAQQAAIEDAFSVSPDAGNTNNGTINWDYTIAEADLDFLAVGETVTVVYTITVDDANGGTDTRDVTVTISGANDEPDITSVDVTGSITEGSTLNDSGSIIFTDADLTDTPTATEVTKSVTTTLTLTAAQQTAIEDAFTISPDALNTNDGTINWDYTITDAELDFLSAGETVTVVYTITVDDAKGGTESQDIAVTITGASDAPVITSVDVTGSITEGATHTDSGSITFTDIDLMDTPTASEATKSVTTALTLTAAQQAAIEDAFTISPDAGNTNDGTINWDYTITEAELDFLAVGETITAVFTITVDDGNGGTDARDVTITITGANDALVITSVDATGSITEGSTLTDTGSITFTDLDLTDTPTATEVTKSVTTALTLTAAQQTAIEDAFTISPDAGNTNDGTINWDYTIAEVDLDFLAVGETVTVVYTITVDDGKGSTDTRDVTIILTGTNDVPTATNLNAAEAYTEDTILDLTDIVTADIDTDTVAVTLTLSDVTAGVLSTGTTGLVSSTFAAGVWTASGAIADVNTLLAGTTFTPSLDYNSNFTIATSVDDGIAPPVNGVKNMTATAVNDAPVINTSSSQATSRNVTVIYSSGTGNGITIDDVDAGANLLQITLTANSGLLTLGSIPAGISFSPGSDGIADASMTFTGNLTDINTALDGLSFAPDFNFTGVTSFEIIANDLGFTGTGGAQSATSTAIINVSGSLKSLWLSTDHGVKSSNAPGLSSWDEGEVIEFSDPNLAFDPVTTSGTFSAGLDLTSFTTSGIDIKALHYVTETVVVGGNAFPSITLLDGDVVLTVDNNESFTSTNSLSVTKNDVFVFRPDVAGDYSSGTFIMLLEDPVGDEIQAISLVEQDTTVGNPGGETFLQKGSFLFVASDDANQIRIFTADDVGSGTTTGSTQILLDGDDTNVGDFNSSIYGLELIEQTTDIGGVSLSVGNILATVHDEENIGSNALPVTRYDVFVLDIARTTLAAGAGNGEATAALLFDGSDVTIDDDGGHLDALTLVTTIFNNAPTVVNPVLDQAALENAPFLFTFAVNTFDDVDGDSLVYSVTLGDGSTLPGWLSFDMTTRTLSGTPTLADVGTLVLKVTADDGKGGMVSDEFVLTVNKVDTGPIVVISPPDPVGGPPPPIENPPVDPPTGETEPGPDPEADSQPPRTGGADPVDDSSSPEPGEPASPQEPAPEPGNEPTKDEAAEPEADATAEAAKPVDSSETGLRSAQGKLLDIGGFVKELDEQRNLIHETDYFQHTVVGSTMTVTTGLSVGYVVWLIRGGVLLSSLLSSLPAWRWVDPLPVLGSLARDSDDDEDDASLEELVEGSGDDPDNENDTNDDKADLPENAVDSRDE